MAESAPLKKSSIIKEWMVQADAPKEPNDEKNWWSVATPFFKYSNTLKKICCLYKSLKLQIDPLNKHWGYRSSKKAQKGVVPKATLASKNIYNIAIPKKFYT